MNVSLERHRYAPELNTLILGAKRIKIGFFAMNYNPTLQQAINYAYSKGLISELELDVYKLEVQTVANTHNLAFWEGKKTYIHPISGKEERVSHKVMKNFDSFHTYGA